MPTYVWMAGGRGYHWTPEDDARADALHAEYAFALVLTGGAGGLDAGAGRWAAHRGIAQLIVPPNWEKWGSAAGPIRNGTGLWVMQTLARACREAPDMSCLVVLWPGGTSTADVRKRAHKAGLAVIEMKVGSLDVCLTPEGQQP